MPLRVSPAKTPLDSTRDYKISSYGLMLSDKVRVSAYAEALRRTVTPEAIVLDLGSGVGIFALLACRLGARRVYGIERQDVVALSKRIADANALSDRIEFIQGTSTDVRLPETADIVISDMRGVLPLFESHVPSIIDARSRFLSPGGTLIPSRDFLWVSVVEVPDLYDRYMGVWCADSYGLNLELGRREAANVVLKERLTVDQLITEPRLWATLQYDKIGSADVAGEAVWKATRKRTAHGICLWFESELTEGVYLSNAPGAPPLVYGQLFLPLSDPVELCENDTIQVRLQANLVGRDYVWRWSTLVTAGSTSSRIKAQFDQSSFYGLLRSPRSYRQPA